MARVARLGLVIDSSGAVTGATQTRTALEGVTTTATRAQASVTAATSALTRSGVAQAAAATQAASATTVATASTTRHAAAILATSEATGAQALSAKSLIAAWAAETAAEEAATAATVAHKAAITGTTTATAGAARGLGLLGGAFGAVVIAVQVAGVAYEIFTSQTRKLKEEQDAARKSLQALADAQRQGAGGKLVDEVSDQRSALRALTADIAALNKELARPVSTSNNNTGSTNSRAVTEARLAAKISEYNELQSLTERGEIKIAQLEDDAAVDRFAKLRTANALTVAETKQVNEQVLGLKKALAANLATSGDLTERGRLVDQIKALTAVGKEDTSAKKEATAAERLFNQQLDRSIERFEVARKNRDALNKSFATGEKAVKAQRDALALLKAQQDINATADERARKDREDEAEQLERVRKALVALYSLGPNATLKNIANANTSIEEIDRATQGWGETLKGVLGVAVSIGGSFGQTGRELAAIIQTAGAVAQLASRPQSGTPGTGAGTLGKGAAAAVGGALPYIGAALVLADQLGLFENAAKKAAEGQRAYTKTLEDFAIVQRTTVEEQLRANLAKANEAAQGALAAAGSKGSVSFTSVEQLDDAIGLLRRGPKEFQRLADELAKLAPIIRDNIATIQAEAAARLQVATEDLAVRRLIAAGQTDAAAAESLRLAQLREILAAEKEFGQESPYLASLKAVQAAEREAAETARALAAAEKRLQQERQAAAFGADLVARRQSLNGDDRGAFITRGGISAASELASADALLKAGTITQAMFDELARVLSGELTKAIEDFDKAARAAAEAIAQEKAAKFEELAVRALIAQGDEAGAAALRREIANKKELDGVTDAALIAQIQYVQNLEAIAIAMAEAARVERERVQQNADITRREIEAYRILDPVKAAELEQLQEEIARQALLAGAIDAATKARYEELFALEDQAKALNKLATEQRAAAAAAEKLANLTASVEEEYLRSTGRGFDADVKALERRRDDRLREAQASGASDETLRQIKAIFESSYTALIAATIDKAATPGTGGLTGTGDVEILTQAVSRSISAREAIRLIDVASAQLDALRQIVRNTSGGATGGVSVAVTVAGGAIGGTSTEIGASIASAVVPALDQALGRRVGIERRFAGNATL